MIIKILEIKFMINKLNEKVFGNIFRAQAGDEVNTCNLERNFCYDFEKGKTSVFVQLKQCELKRKTTACSTQLD
jgi:hypothetical protein